MFVIN